MMNLIEELNRLNEKYSQEMTIGLFVSDGSQQVVSKNEGNFFVAANLMKLPVYLYYMEQASKGQIDLSETISVPSDKRISGSGVLHLIPHIEEWTIQDLLIFMIAVSDHEATNHLIAKVGLRKIQEWIKTKPWADEVCLRRYLMDYASGLVNECTPKGAVSVLAEIIDLGRRHPEMQELIEKPFIKQQFRNGLPGYLNEKGIPVLEILNKTEEDVDLRHDVALFRYKEQTIYVAAFTSEVKDEIQAYAWLQEIGKLIFQYMIEKV